MDEAAVGTGVIVGKWDYVWAVYIATWVTVIGLAVRALVLSRASTPPSESP